MLHMLDHLLHTYYVYNYDFSHAINQFHK